MNRQSVLLSTRRGLGLMILLGTLGGTALAQKPPHEMLAAAWQDIEKTVDGVLTPGQHARLNDIAYAAAVDSLCAGFNLDETKFKAEFQALAPEQSEAMNAQEVNYFKQHLLVNYGLIAGLFMAEGALDQTGFCQAADETRNDPEIAHLWQ